VILVYDSTVLSSFSNVETWLNQIEKNADEDIMKILVANKMDLPDQEVSEDDGRRLAEKHNMEFYATSAKTGENVEAMFEDVSQKVISKQQLKKEQQAKLEK